MKSPDRFQFRSTMVRVSILVTSLAVAVAFRVETGRQDPGEASGNWEANQQDGYASIGYGIWEEELQNSSNACTSVLDPDACSSSPDCAWHAEGGDTVSKGGTCYVSCSKANEFKTEVSDTFGDTILCISTNPEVKEKAKQADGWEQGQLGANPAIYKLFGTNGYPTGDGSGMIGGQQECTTCNRVMGIEKCEALDDCVSFAFGNGWIQFYSKVNCESDPNFQASDGVEYHGECNEVAADGCQADDFTFVGTDDACPAPPGGGF